MESPPNYTVLLALFFVIFDGAVAVPLSRKEQCARHCTESNKFQYSPGSTYTYDYETTTTTMLSSTSEEKSKLQMRAQVDIEVMSKCEFSMRLRGVTLKQTDPYNVNHLVPVKGGRDFSRSIEKRILRFSYQDGVVQEICPDENAEPWITNIQRGVLSALQNSMRNLEGNERLIETDVSGKCPVEYQSLGRSWTGVLTIKKIKGLNTCTDRENSQTSLQGTPFMHGSSIQSRPLLAGQQECEQNVGKGILQSSSCTELLIFRPFSRDGSGATTVVNQKLTYAAVSKKTFTGNDYRLLREHLLYNHDMDSSNEILQQEADKALADVCEHSQTEISMSVPAKFANFVYTLRKLDYDTLVSMFRRTQEICPSANGRKFFLDAMPIVSTSDSVRLMADMISRKDVSTSEANFWFTSLSFVSKPSAEMIQYLTPLLNGQHDQAYLGVSSLIHTFCKTNDCSQVPEVRDAVYTLFDNLGENCFNPDVRKILLTLKSIGNIGIAFGREKILERCATNPQLKTEVRLAAIQAFRRFSCDIPREMFLLTFTNYKERAELRIASYLAVINCPTAENLQIVRETLENEQVNQVGSFVWTHLQALAKSRHPERQDIRDMLSNLYLLNKYNSDIRKFSSAHEASFYLESIDSGLHLDSHVVFPTHSFLPHSAMVNLTVDIFGHSCNLLQLDGRMEGIERVMERFFGPGGYFPQKDVTKLFRGKRSISDNKIDRMDSSFDVKSEFDEKPYGSLDVKIFGNTLWYNQFEELPDGETSSNLVDIVADLAKDRTVDFTRSFMFLDSTYTIPVASGLPLRLDLNGTASVRVNVGGKFNLRTFKNVDIHAHLEPSGTVEIAGLLTVDAGTTSRTGLRISATMHSSTYLDSKIQVENGQVVKASLNMPKEKIDIIDLRSKLYLVHGGGEQEQDNAQENGYVMDSCTGETLNKVLGIKLCSQISLPGGPKNAPMYPMNGAATLSVYIKKTDPKLTQYTFGASYEEKKVKGQTVRDAVISLNTPQSKIDREISMKLHHSEPDNTINFDVKTPVKKFGFKANFLNTEQQKKLDVSSTVDNREIFSAKCDMRRKVDGGSITYYPSVEVHVPSKRVLSLAGSMNVRQGAKYSAQLTMKDVTEKPITLKANVEMNKQEKRYEGEVDFSSFALDSNVKWDAQLSDGLSGKINTEYRLMEGKPYKTKLNVKLRDLSAAALTKYNGLLNVQTTSFPEWETTMSWDMMSTRGHLENSLSIKIGDTTRSRVHEIQLQEIISYGGSLKNNSVDATFKLSYPAKNINYNLKMKHQNTERSLKNSIDFKYQKNKQISTAIDVGFRTESPVSFRGDLKVQYPGREMKLTSELAETRMKEYRLSTSVQWQRGQQASFVGQYRNKSDRTKTKHELDAEIKLPNRLPINALASFGAQGSQYAGFAEIKDGVQHYRASADYSIGPSISHKMSAQLVMNSEVYATEASLQSSGDKLSGNVDVKMPGRQRYSASVDVKQTRSFRSASMEMMWDADRDRTKRFAVDGELHTKNNGYDAKFTTQYHRRTIRGTLTTSRDGQLFGGVLNSLYKGELEWSPRNKATVTLSNSILLDRVMHRVSSALTVTTPYRGYEVLSLTVRHADENSQWSSEMKAVIGASQKYTIFSDGKYGYGRNDLQLDANVGVQTSIPSYENIVFNVSHYHNRRQFSNKLQATWNLRKLLVSEVYRFPTETGFKSGLKLQTPWSYLEDISAEVIHGSAPDGYKTTCDLKWAPGQVTNIVIDSRHQLNGKRRICSVNIEAVSPVKGFETVSWRTTYDNDGTTMNTGSELHWNRRKMTFGITGYKRNSYFEKNVEGKIYFTSPFEKYENSQLATVFKYTPDSLIFSFDTKLPYEHTISLNAEGKAFSLKRIDLNTVMRWKLPYIRSNQKFSMNIEHKIENSQIRTAFDASYGKKKATALLTASNTQSYRSRNLEGSLIVNMPIKGFEEMKVDVVHTNQDWTFMSRLQTALNGEGIALVHELNVRDALNFESSLHMTSYVKGVSNWKATVSQIYNPGYLLHNSNLLLNNKNAFAVNLKYQDKLPAKELGIRVETLYEQLKNFELEAEYELGNGELKSKLRAKLNDREQITFDGSAKHYGFRTAETQLSLTSTINSSQRYQLTGRYDVTTPKKTVDLSVEWNQGVSKTVSLSGSFLMSKDSPYFDVIVKTPFRAAERLGLSGRAENRAFDKSLFLEFEINTDKTTLTANYDRKPAELNLNAGLTSPYLKSGDVRLSAKYKNDKSRGMNAEVFLQLDDEKRISFTTRVTLADRAVDGKVSLMGPFGKHGPYSLDFSGDISGKKKTANLVARWDSRNKVEMYADCEVLRGREGKFTITFKSPFRKVKDVMAAAEYTISPKEVKGKMNINSGSQVLYSGQGNYKKGESFTVAITTPYAPLRNARYSVVISRDVDVVKTQTNIKWEDKEIESIVSVANPKNGPFKVQIDLKTPFTTLQHLNFDGQMLTSRKKIIDGQFSLRTSLDMFRKLDFSALVKSEADVYDMLIKLNTELKSLMISGQTTKAVAVPFKASLSVDAPFASFKNVVAKLTVDETREKPGKMVEFSVVYPDASHVISAGYMRDNSELLVSISAESPLLRSEKVALNIKSTLNRGKKFELNANVMVNNEEHRLVTFCEQQNENVRYSLAARSSLLPGREAELGGTYSVKRRSNKINGEITLLLKGQTHKVSAVYQRDINQATVEAAVDSDLISSNTVKLTTKYVNGNNRDIALIITLLADSKHEFITNLKNYDSEKLIEFKATSPILPQRMVSVTGTIKNDNADAVDGVITVLANNKEYRIASSMKRRGWENIEGFLTVNTPHEPLRMLRADIGYKNENFRNFDFNLKFKSSHRRYDSVGVTMKLNRARGSEDLSVVLNLPSQQYPTIQLLGSVHYDREMSVADSRITISLNPDRYSWYGGYKLQGSGVSLEGEFEKNARKWSASGQMQVERSRRVSLYGQFSTPERRMYSASGSASSSEGQHSIAVNYRLPRQEPFSLNATMDYFSMENFNGIIEASTPIPEYRQFFLRLQNQKSGRVQTFLNGEFVLNDFRSFFNMFQRVNNTDSLTTIRLGTPYRSARELEFTYNGNGQKRSFYIAKDGRQTMKGEVIKSRGVTHTTLDIPVLPMTVSARSRSHQTNQEFLLKSNYQNRAMLLKYTHRRDAASWINEGVFTWDERQGMSLGYSAKLSQVSNGQLNGKELHAKLTFPRREFELKGKLAKSGRVRSGGVDFYWDASKDKGKHMTVGVEHHELSRRNEISHKLQITFTHPVLQRDLVHLNTLVIKPNEIVAHSEIQYSRQNEQNLIADFRAQDLSRADQHYKAELSLRHAVVGLNFKVAGELVDGRSESMAHVSVSNLNSRSQRSVHELKAKLHKQRRHIDVEMRDDRTQHLLSGGISKEGNDVSLSVAHLKNGQDGFQSRFRYNPVYKSLDLNVTGLGNGGVLMSASFPDDSVSFKLSHFSDVSHVTDAFVFVGIEKSRILRSRVNWRPGMWRDLRIATEDVVRSSLSSADAMARSTAESIKQEFLNKAYSVKREVGNHLNEFYSAISEDSNAIYNDLEAVRQRFWNMYRNNEFYMKDIVSMGGEAYHTFRRMCNYVSDFLEIMTNIILHYADEYYYRMVYAIEDAIEYLKDRCCKLMCDLKTYSVQMLRKASDLWLCLSKTIGYTSHKLNAAVHAVLERLAASLEPVVKSYAPFIIDTYYYIRLKSDMLRNTINDFIKSVVNSRLYLALEDYWKRVVYTIETFELADLTSTLQSRILMFGERAGLFMQRISDAQLLDMMRNQLPVDYIVRSTLQKGADLYEFLGINQLLKRLAHYATEHVKNTILTSGNDLLFDFYQMRSSVKYEFDPKKGYFALEYMLPSPRNTMYDFINSLKSINFQKIKEIKNTIREKYYEDFCIWDMFYSVKNIMKPSSWMPPFDAHAIIAGNQHFVTFDQYSFDFAGECSYLLTRDFLDGNFTVVANYKKEGQKAVRKSITVMSDEFKVDVATDHKVTLNDVKVELPVRAGDTIVYRDGVSVRVENKKKGFVLTCNLVYNVCTVGMSGYYFGKTGGILGTYDNEPQLDMMTPERTLATDVESFVNSWEVGKDACRRGENMATIPSNDRTVYEKCQELFGKTSSNFRPCFKQVDPAAFMRMCVSDLSVVDQESYESAICTSAAAYFTQCNIAGVALRMPKSCVRCERSQSSTMFEGDMSVFLQSHRPVSADVVFVVEEKKCNAQNFKFLSKLSQSIEDNFRQKGFLNIRYRVIGFGGDDVHAEPHIHTMDGQEFGSIRSVESAFLSLQVGDGPTNMLEALRYAASLNYEPGSKKIFVLIKCSTCDVHENKAEYGEILRTMLDGDADLHLLMEQKYEMRIANKNSKAKRVIGLDKNYAYTLKDAKDANLEGDGDLQMQLKIPKDICVSLALEVNGSSFDSQYISDTRRNTYKKFMDVMARRMAKSAAQRPHWTMCCECIASTDGVGKSACQKCVSNELAEVADIMSVVNSIEMETKRQALNIKRSEKKRRSH